MCAFKKIYSLPTECIYALCVDLRTSVKVKFTIEQAIKTQRGSRGIAVLFF